MSFRSGRIKTSSERHSAGRAEAGRSGVRWSYAITPLRAIGVQDADISADAKALWLEYEVFLVEFEEHGVADYGAVSSPRFNMARPSPVFLNGDFRLTYVVEVPPEGREMLPEYEGLPEFPTAWVEYSSLVGATTEGGSQVFAIEMPIQECRACQAIGYLNLEVNFQGGSLGEVTVPR